jgi:hypothetical protein
MKALTAINRSPSIRGAILFAMSGAAFAVGNLLIAAGLPQRDYGHFALFVGAMAITSNVAPLGLDQILLRRHLRLSWSYVRPILLSAVAIGLGAGVVTRTVYGLPWAQVLALGVGTVVYATLRTIAAALRRHGFATVATAAETCTDWMILLAGIGVVIGKVRSGEAIAIFLAAAGVGLAILAAGHVRRFELGLRSVDGGARVREAMPLLGIVAAGAVAVQGERLLVPLLLSIDALATLAVLYAIAMSPFRVLSAGIIASFAQQMRVTTDGGERRQLVRHETRLFAAMALLGSAAITLAGPIVGEALTAGRYQLSPGLCAAACLGGCVRILQAIPRAVAIGIGTAADLARLNAYLWIAIAGMIAGAIIGAEWGLAMLVMGAAMGSALATLPMWVRMQTMLSGHARFDTEYSSGSVQSLRSK